MSWRPWLVTLVFLAVALLGVFATVNVLVGVAEQNAADHTYIVGFSHPGADCGAGAQSFDVTTGDALSCVQDGEGAGSDEADFPGFTEAQNEQVTDLASQLGADGLSSVDQQRIQHLVDQLATTVPAGRRPHYDQGVSLEPLWGAGLAWTSGGVIAFCALCFVVGMRSAALRRWMRGGR